MGSNKINAHCPAKMEVTIHENEKVTVTFCKTHVGHEMDVSRLYLKKQVRDEIAQKLALEIPFDNILDEIRDLMSSDEFKRVHLLTRKDLFNIEKQYNLNNHTKDTHNNCNNNKEFVTFESWISQLQLSNNLIRFYKPRGKLSPSHQDLKEKDFVLIISNEAQLEGLKKFGNHFVCMDNTHCNTKLYSYDLITLLTITDKGDAFPCAFLITNKTDLIVLTLFVSIVRKNLNTALKPTYFMASDASECYLDAWCGVMGEPPEIALLSPWYVDQSWRKNLRKITNKEKQVVTYKMLRTLLEERDVITFEIMFEQILYELSNDVETVGFVQYFSQFKNSAPKWAFCHRTKLGGNVNESLEKMHRTLKHLYLSSAKTKRLDKAIYSVMRFLRDKFLEDDALFKVNAHNNNFESLRRIHGLSSSMAQNSVKKVGNVWKVPSSCVNETFEVSETNRACKCGLRCGNCDICMHNFVCSCLENELKWNMCKHIHLIGEILKSGDVSNGDDNEIDISNAEVIIQEMAPVESSLLNAKKAELLRKFKTVLNQIYTVDDCVFIENALASILPSLKNGTGESQTVSSFVNVVVQGSENIYTVITK